MPNTAGERLRLSDSFVSSLGRTEEAAIFLDVKSEGFCPFFRPFRCVFCDFAFCSTGELNLEIAFPHFFIAVHPVKYNVKNHQASVSKACEYSGLLEIRNRVINAIIAPRAMPTKKPRTP